MKKWLKKIAGRVMRSVIDHFEPKIEDIENPISKKVLKFILSWVDQIIDVLTDTDPNDKEQLEQLADKLIDVAPEESLEIAKLIIERHVKDEEAKLLIVGIVDDVIEEVS